MSGEEEYGYIDGPQEPMREVEPEPAHGLREGAASETDAETGPESHPRNSIALESESKVGTNGEAERAAARAFLIEEGIITSTALDTMIRLTKERDEAREDCGFQKGLKDSIKGELSTFIRLRQEALDQVAQRDATIARMAADLLAKDDTIDRLTRVTQIIMATADDNLAAKDVTIDRLWAQLNEATNVPEVHSWPELTRARAEIKRLRALLIARASFVSLAEIMGDTNVTDHNDPEFGFDKTAALSEPDEDPS